MPQTDAQFATVVADLRSGRLDRARATLAAQFPGRPEEWQWVRLAALCGEQQLLHECIRCCDRALAVNPASAPACSTMARAHALLGDSGKAVELSRRAVQLQPGNPALHFGHGNHLYAAGDYEAALRQYRKVLELDSGSAPAHHMIAMCCQVRGETGLLVHHYQQALKLDPALVDSRVNLGFHYSNIGELERAQDCFGQALARQPDHPGALNGKAELLQKRGDRAGAWRLVRQLIDSGRAMASTLSVYANLVDEYGDRDELVTLATAMLDNPGVSRPDRSAAGFALGRLYDRAGDYALAFHSYRAANELSYQGFDRAGWSRYIDAIIEAYDQEFVAHCPRAGTASEQPVFIVGMPRSGTSLVEQILSMHTQVHAAGELTYLTELATFSLFDPALRPAAYPAGVHELSREMLERLAAAYLGRFGDAGAGAQRLTDKTPANYRYLGLIMQLFPRARVIHCTRDPRDTCLSVYFQNFQNFQPFAARLDDIAFFYAQYRKLMSHWQQLSVLPVLEVSYESVVADVEGAARRIVAFCGLDWEPRCLDFHRSRRLVKTASAAQVNRPIYADSVGRWRHYREYLAELETQLRPWITDRAG